MRTKNKAIKALLAIAATAALALTGCSTGGGGGDDDTFKVIAFTSGNQTPVGAWWVQAVTAQAEELGWELTMIQGDFDFQKMNAAVESAIGQGADVIFNGYTDEASIGSIVTAAEDAGIPIFAMDSGDGRDRRLRDQHHDRPAGHRRPARSPRSMRRSAGSRARTSWSSATTRTRESGCGPVWPRRRSSPPGPSIAGGEIQKVTSPATGRTEALALVADYIAANPGKLDGVWVGWDDAALGAAQGGRRGRFRRQGHRSGCGERIDRRDRGRGQLPRDDRAAVAVDPRRASLPRSRRTAPTARCRRSKFEAVPTVLVNKDNAADITPSDQLSS